MIHFETRGELAHFARVCRNALEPAFGPETAAAGFSGSAISKGQCAAVAAVLFARFGGKLVSTRVDGQSHWFNRFMVGPTWMDLDITGDQFGRPPIQLGAVDELYEGTRERAPSEINDETRARAVLLAKRAGMDVA